MTTPKVNQAGDVPRIPGGAGFTFSRGKFLDGTLKTYYGPGQRPDSGPVQAVDYQAGGFPWRDYSPPDDWPGAGTLLRVPQVAWLSLLLDGRASHIGTTVEGSGDLLVPSVTWWGANALHDFAWAFEYQNVIKDQFDRLIAIFVAVKGRIEGLRPGRTWVMIPDWGVRDDPTLFPTQVQDGFHNGLNLWTRNSFPCMRAPHRVSEDGTPNEAWFGVDFLHVYAGQLFYDFADAEDAFPVRFPWDGTGGDPDPSANSSDDLASLFSCYGNSHADVLLADRNFSRYAVRAWDAGGLDWAGAFTGDFGVGFIISSTVEDPPHRPFPTTPEEVAAQAADDAADLAHVIALANAMAPAAAAVALAAFATTFAGNAASMGLLCAALAGQGLDFAGEGSLLGLDEESLVKLIADHYRFDPDTGKDLPDA